MSANCESVSEVAANMAGSSWVGELGGGRVGEEELGGGSSGRE